MNKHINTAIAASLLLMAGHASAQITFYEGEGYRGRAFTTEKNVDNFGRTGFNDRASSVVVDRGRWEACEDAGFRGRCVVLRAGNYESLQALGLQDRISSVRAVSNDRNYSNQVEPVPGANYAYRRRANERVYEAQVISARAVVGQATERCWLDRQQVSQQPSRGSPNIGGAIVGGLLGGVLGHQVGGGSGKDIATVGGAVAGAAIGSNVGRSDNGAQYSTQSVRRCENVASTVPTYWDVTYRHRGIDHQVQMSSDPGQTVAVNRNGEPRL